MVNMDISDTLISFETAKLAKEKGFIIPTLCYFRYDEKQCKGSLLDWNEDVGFYSRPTQALLAKWLREVHNIFVEVLLDQTSNPKFAVEIYQYTHFGNYDKVNQKDWSLYRTYEEALEVGLLNGLKLIKTALKQLP